MLFVSFYRWEPKNQVVKVKNIWHYGAPNFKCDISEYLALKAQLLLDLSYSQTPGYKTRHAEKNKQKNTQNTQLMTICKVCHIWFVRIIQECLGIYQNIIGVSKVAPKMLNSPLLEPRFICRYKWSKNRAHNLIFYIFCVNLQSKFFMHTEISVQKTCWDNAQLYTHCICNSYCICTWSQSWKFGLYNTTDKKNKPLP